jgi:type IV secretory pathway TrbF-like protein
MSADDMTAVRPKIGAGSAKRGRSRSSAVAASAFVLFFLILLIANYLVGHLFFAPSSSIAIPYTFFKQQVEAGNVQNVTSNGIRSEAPSRRR